MQNPPAIKHTQTLYPSVAFLFFIGLLYFIYAQALGGRLLFDDVVNLESLTFVFADGQFHTEAARRFVLGGDAGPLGRPLSLLTFLLDGSGWPDDVAALLYTNILLHLLNATLLAAVLLTLGRALGWSWQRAAWVAVASSALWALAPLIASASLMPIQRMTLLSSTFMLLGMWGYLAARQSLEAAPIRTMLLMGLVIGTAGLAGVFSKEQAALLPGFILLMEWLLLPKPYFNPASTRAPMVWRAFRWLALVLPLLLILGYLAKSTINHEAAYAMRSFDLYERLATELFILWDYVRLSFLPRPASFSPFYDGIKLHDFKEVFSWLALASWLALWTLALILRSRFPWLLFALAWFWMAHLLESTVLPLELYFEHRNYLAFIGVWFALVAVVADWALKNKGVRLAAVMLFAYASIQGFMLWQVTSLYGNPRLAAELWAIDFPHSERAAQLLANTYTLEHDYTTALKVIDEAAERSDKPSGLRLQGFQLACVLGEASAEQLGSRIEQLKKLLPNEPDLRAISSTLNQLRLILQKDNCKGVLNEALLYDIAIIAMQNPQFAKDKISMANIEIIVAAVSMDQRKLEPTLEHLEGALSYRPDLDTLELTLGLMNSAGLFEEGLKLIDRHSGKLSSTPLRKNYDQNFLEHLREQQIIFIAEAMQESKNE